MAWSLAVPIFEGPDEPAHWQYASFLHEKKRLPVYGPKFVEGNQPPLYYLLIAPASRSTEPPPHLMWMDGVGKPVIPWPPHFFQNSVDDFQRYWPIRMARLVTALLSVLAVLFTYLAGVAATGRSTTGALAAGLVAFLPTFTFRGMTVSNDALVTTLSTASLYLILRLISDGFTWRLGVVTSAVVALAFLSKINAVFLPVPLGLAILADRAPLAVRLRRLSVLLVGIVLATPWMLRNLALYGDLFGVRAMPSAVPFLIGERPLTSAYFVGDFPWHLSRSLVGVLGWMNIDCPGWLYVAFAVLGAAGLVGYAWAALRKQTSLRLGLVLWSFPILSLLLVVRMNMLVMQPQGRYLFPALGATAVLLAIGLESLPGWSPAATRLTVVALAALNLYVLLRVVMPAYWPPPLQTVGDDVLELRPRRVVGLSSTAEPAEFVVADTKALLLFDIDADASRFRFLRFAISAKQAPPETEGVVRFATEGAEFRGDQQLTFAWLRDGKRRNITLPLVTHPAWRGHVTALRIDPVRPAGEGDIGSTLRLEGIQLRSRLP